MFLKYEPPYVTGQEFLSSMEQFAIVINCNEKKEPPVVQLNKWCLANNCVPLNFDEAGGFLRAVVRRK